MTYVRAVSAPRVDWPRTDGIVAQNTPMTHRLETSARAKTTILSESNNYSLINIYICGEEVNNALVKRR